MSEIYSPTGNVSALNIKRSTIAEAATGTHGQEFMRDNITQIADRIRYLGDDGLLKSPNVESVNVKDSPYSAVGDGTADDRAALFSANAAAKRKVVPVGTAPYKVGSNLTMSGVWHFVNGAKLKPNAAVAITLDSTVRIIADSGDWLDLSAGGTLTANNGSFVATVEPGEAATGLNRPNVRRGHGGNRITPAGSANTIAGGGGVGTENIIGSVDTPAAGQINVATIGGGYDNINDHLSGTIAGGSHNRLNGDVPTASHGTIGGGSTNTVEKGDYCTIAGGKLNKVAKLRQDASAATPSKGTIGGGESNQTSALNATIGGGLSNICDSEQGFIGGGGSNLAGPGLNCTIGGGSQNTASADYSTVPGGRLNQATAIYAEAHGLQAVGDQPAGITRSGGAITVAGDSQNTTIPLRKQTTDATLTPALLASGGSTMVMLDDSTWGFVAYISARRTDADNESAFFKIEGSIDRNSGAASTALVAAATVTVIARDAACAAVTCSASANTGNGGLRINVQGEAAKTFNWHVMVILAQVKG